MTSHLEVPKQKEDLFFVEDQLVDLLEATQSYLQSQDEIGSHFANGIFSMTLARKQKGIFIARANDVREDIYTSVRLLESPDANQSFELSLSTKSEDILHICALPSPSLRKAQNEFQQILRSVMEAQSAAMKLRRTLRQINPTDPSVEETTQDEQTSNIMKEKEPTVESTNIRGAKAENVVDEDDDDDDDEAGFEEEYPALPEILNDNSDHED
jgi:hypothetical protein